MEVPRFEVASATVEGKLYVFGGFGPRAQATIRCDVFDPTTNSWKRLADMPRPLTHVNAVVDGRAIWIAGGFDGNSPGPAVADLWKYDVDSNAFKPGPPLPEPRGGGGLARVGRTLHYFGGLKADRDTDAADHWTLNLDGAGAWKTAAPMPEPRNQFGVAVLAGKIYAIGGQFHHDRNLGRDAEDQPLVHVYDPATDAWAAGSPLPKPLSHIEPSTFVADGLIITVGGRSLRGQASDVYGFDPARAKWQTLPPLAKGVYGPAAALVGDRIVVAGGASGGSIPQAEAWTISLRDAWGRTAGP
jgi:N-acetylneuraminic acid mutarotase